MQRQTLTLVTAPTTEPVTLAEAKLWAKIDYTDDDDVITQLITAARFAAEQYTRRSLITQTWNLRLDLPCSGYDRYLGDGVHDLPISYLYGNFPQAISLPHEPVQSITSVQTYGTDNVATTFDPANYTLDAQGARLCLNSGSLWPTGVRPIGGMEITYKTGYGDTAADVPQPIKTGITILVAYLYEQRGVCGDEMPQASALMFEKFRLIGSRK